MQIPEIRRKISAGRTLSILFLFINTISLLASDPPEEDYIRNYYSVKDGLSQNEVTSIVQDKYGFMWFGTRGGLNRFDGYDFLKFKPEPGVNSGLRSPSIETLFTDREKKIWIGTKSGGVLVYEMSKAGFTNPGPETDFPHRIVSFFQDKKGHYWIGSWDNGVFEYDPEKEIVNHFMTGLRVSSIMQTQDGSMWFGTSTGLRFIKPGENEVRRYNLGEGYYEVTEIIESPEDSTIWLVGWNVGLVSIHYSDLTHVNYTLNGSDSRKLSTYSLLKDGDGQLWIGTWGYGLFRFNTRDHSSRRINIYPRGSLKPSLDYDIVLDIFQDLAGDIWTGTDGGGVVRISTTKNFRTLLRDQSNEHGAWHVNAVHISRDGELWIGTRAVGLYATSDMKSFDYIGFEDWDPSTEKTAYQVKRLNYGPEGQLWVSLENGLYVVNEDREGRRILINAAKLFNSEDLRQVRKVLDVTEYKGDLWVATQQNGLYWFQKRGGQYQLRKNFRSNDPYASFEDNRISSLLTDNFQNLWIGTYKGLYRMGPNDTIPVPAGRFMENSAKFLCEIILSLAADRSNCIWIGTPCGLNCLTESQNGTYNFKEYTRRDGLTDDYINAIELSQDFTWVSTNAGISRIQHESGEIRNYDVSDEVYGYNFSEGASSQSPDGTIYFGGSSDITYFNPGEFTEDPTIPTIAITSFKVMNQEVPVTGKEILTSDINEVDRIVLGHRQREFSFEIASLDYSSPENNQYAYRLVSSRGNEGDWVYTGQRRHISFSNLRSGEYTLFLAGTSSNGIWNREGRKIMIKVLPPPWRTVYALIIYIAIILLIVVLINSFTLQKERLKNLAELEHMTRMKDNELNEFKLRFFTDISHELKTPLSLIQAPVEELISRNFSTLDESFFRKRMRLIHGSSIRLIDLLNQLLEFRKVEVGKAVLKSAEQDVARYIAIICEAYSYLAKRKKIEFNADIPTNDIPLWFEPSKMDVIVNNLLSNAFKYSGTPGKVWLRLEESEHEVLLEVSNDGEGISKDEINHLFERFYQASGGSYKMGSGIGLDLVKRFVEMHKGQISVESEPGEFTRFTVRFLKGEGHLSANERTGKVKEVERPAIFKENITAAEVEARVEAKVKGEVEGEVEGEGRAEAKVKGEAEAEAEGRAEAMVKGEAEGKAEAEAISPGLFPRGTRGAKILVVDDNEQVREYLADLLGDYFTILFAADGSAGYELAIEQMPDLVVSDVIMPLSDGYELCARLKKNEKTSHIPVILLTGKGGKEEQLTGTRYGADAYITKPFDPALLFEKIKQLIAGRVVLREKFSRKLTLDPLNIEISNEDEKMISTVMKIIEKHMDNAALDSEFIAGEIGMSASTFYRRMKKTVGQSPGEFIKSTRMKMAARYLKESELTVSEIVERVGYTDIRNFRKSFADEFGVSPAEYRKM